MNTTLPSPNGLPQLAGSSRGAVIQSLKSRMFDPIYTTINDGGQVKMSLFGRPIPELLDYSRAVHTAMEGNEYFLDPFPPQAELAATIDEAQAREMEVISLKCQLAAALARRDTAVEKLVGQMNQRGTYVQLASGGNSVRILSAGIDVRRSRRPAPRLEPPTGLFVELTGTEGTAILTWNKEKDAKMYMIEYGPIDGPKTQQAVRGQRKLVLENLPLGELTEFRVCAMGGATGQSSWSPWVKRGIA